MLVKDKRETGFNVMQDQSLEALHNHQCECHWTARLPETDVLGMFWLLV